MKNKIVLFIICFFSIVVSCSHSKNDKNKPEEINKSDSLAQKDEDFHTFLENFSSKPTFQRRRVLFPVEARVLDPSDYGMQTVKEDINYQDWILLDFSYDSSYATRQMDSYNQHIRVYNDSTIIEQRGIDNGIFSNYTFTKIEGKWYLKSFTDTSY